MTKLTIAKIKSSLFAIIPIVFFIYFLFLYSQRVPFYHSYNSDPQYIHLFSGLNLAQGIVEIGNLDNPGTPLQVIEAVVIKLTHYFSGEKPLPEDVLANPEKYLRVVNHTLLLISTILIFFLGFVSYKQFSNLWISFLFQLSPFSTWTIFTSFLLVSPEHVLIIASLFLLLVLVPFLEEKQATLKKIVLLSAITGFGVATKLTFIPILIIPFFLISGIKQKFMFSFLSIFFFFLFISPALPHFDYFISWIEGLIFKQGHYGSGEEGILNTHSFLTNLKNKFLYEKTLTFSVAFGFASWIFLKINKINNKQTTFIIASVLALLIQVFISSKDIHLRYLVSGLMFSLPIVLVSFIALLDIKFKWFEITKFYPFLILFVLFIFFKLDDVLILSKSHENSSYEKLTNFLEKEYPKDETIYLLGYRCTSQAYALHYGSLHAGNQRNNYWKILNKLYPNTYLYPWYERQNACTWTDTLSFSEIFEKQKTIVFFGNHLMGSKPAFFNYSKGDTLGIIYKQVFESEDQQVFLILPKLATN